MADNEQQEQLQPPVEDTTATVDAGATEQAATGAETPGEAEQQQDPDWYVRETTKARNRQREAEQTAEQLRRQNAQLIDAMTRARGGEPPQAIGAQGVPQRANYQSDEEFFGAMVDHRVQQGVALGMQHYTAQQERARAVQTYNASRVEAVTKYADYESVAENPALTITGEMAEEIVTSSKPAEVQYWLGKHPEEARRIAILPPRRIAREIGRIEAMVSGGAGNGAVAPAPKASLPPPMKQVSGSAGVSGKRLEDMSFDEYSRTMRKLEAERRY